MDSNVTQIIITLITVCVPALVTVITSSKLRKQNNKHSTRSDIMQLIIEDHVRSMEGFPPENYQIILDSFDEYSKNGGNSYIHDKVIDYKKWYVNNKERSKHAKQENK